MRDIAILIPAAGRSSRMRGQDKLLKDIDGVSLLRRSAERALSTQCHVVVTIPGWEHPRAEILAGLPVQIVEVPDASDGMSASIRRAVAALPKITRGLIILPADMPDITASDIESLIKGFDAELTPTVQQATSFDGTPGHPVLFPSDCFVSLRQLTGDEGARSVLKANRHRLRYVPLPGLNALTDLDTPEAWTRWQSENA
ncbi:nucleotidyltransferase family protein [Thalassococcus lentus]|uniref:Nucleotidyltransferase family protein n=1 Tax=Thalassococcus lentus TaxID=1210524 RepID=A0ABT4XR90_9RHOB|nr:nucleotidyltransferase family protein [Thalassococcus lentus]MDA7424466.1 nucleotidyltransferase family protein [Thalassococcus lentus]